LAYTVLAVVNNLVSVKQTKLHPGAAYAALIFYTISTLPW